MNTDLLIPVILCGGNGTRLWPLSRESYPKQFLSINSESNKSFLQNTQLRLSRLKNVERPILVCNEAHRFIVAEQMREINQIPHKILLEPVGRNTAPAIVISALLALEDYPEANLLILSSDHEIKNIERFLQVIKKGIYYSQKDYLVTFGVVPNSPNTGYGYIEGEEPFDEKVLKGTKIQNFIEKPDLETAKILVKNKHYTWNSGIFLFKASKIIEEIKVHAPSVLEFCKKSLDNKYTDLDFQRLDEKFFKKCPNISIDYAVMEKTKNGIVLPMNVGWSDVGTWQSVWENSPKDKKGNVVLGKTVLNNSVNCFVKSNNRLIVGIGLDDLIVVDCSDVLLVANKKESNKVKNIVGELKEAGITEVTEHKKIFRPWGYYVSVLEDLKWKIKVILVKPSESLSLQMHHHRAEHWVVVNGTAKVEIDSKEKILVENESTFIPIGSKHRLSNPGEIPLILIEIQSGSYLEESDIVRFEDNYGRINKENNQ